MASIWTLTELDEQIAAYKAALLAVTTSQSYKIGTREMTRADLPEIRDTLDWLGRERSQLTLSAAPVSVVMRPRR